MSLVKVNYHYQCRQMSSTGTDVINIHPDQLCDGFVHCPLGDDESDCKTQCAPGLACLSGTVYVEDLKQVCVHVCVCVCVCVFVWMGGCVLVCAYVNVCVCVYMCVCELVYKCVFYVFTCGCLYVFVHMCVFVMMYECLCMCANVWAVGSVFWPAMA